MDNDVEQNIAADAEQTSHYTDGSQSQVSANDGDENNNTLKRIPNPEDGEVSTREPAAGEGEKRDNDNIDGSIAVSDGDKTVEGGNAETSDHGETVESGALEPEPEHTEASDKGFQGEEEGFEVIPSGQQFNDVDAEGGEDGDKKLEKQETEIKAEDAADMASVEESNKADDSLVPTPTPATKIRLNTRKHTTTPADDSGLVQPVLPTANKFQANVQQMTSSISHARRKQDGLVPASKQPARSRVPPKLVRLATVTVSPARSRPAKTASLYYEEPCRPAKVITWDQATNHRPPLRIDMEGPGPCSYSPLNKPLRETNAPCFTFGTKCYPEKEGGARTSWGKSWFQSHHLWHSKADYAREGLWPSPNHYPKPTLLGPRQRTTTEAPSYTFGHKAAFSIVKPGAAKEPSPNDYERQNADSLILRRGPSFTHQFRREGTVLWGSSEKTPAPCRYAPQQSPRVQRPAYTIQGIRREKSHVLGPYSTL